jgi:O-antigen ligase
VGAAHAALLLALWPTLQQPFSAPKVALLGVCGVVALLASLLRPATGPRLVPALALAWLAWLLCSAAFAAAPAPGAIALDTGAALLCLGLASTAGSARGPLRALALLGAVEALVVLAQSAGLDALAALSPHAPGRLRGYGTLGNPDFAAAWLGASLWLAAAEAWAARKTGSGARWLAAALLQMAALAALRSFASLLGLAAGALFALLALRAPARRTPRPAGPSAVRAVALAAALAAALLCAGLGAREPGRALAGRLHLWATGAQALRAAPLFGYGPGAVALLQPGWEAERFASGAATSTQRPFAGAQDHLHQDLLERALEQGLPGAALFLLLLCAGLRSAWRAASAGPAGHAAPRFAAAGAAIASLAARGLVDFPAARPAELALLVTLVALCARASARHGPAPTTPPVPARARATPTAAAALPHSSPTLLGSPR